MLDYLCSLIFVSDQRVQNKQKLCIAEYNGYLSVYCEEGRVKQGFFFELLSISITSLTYYPLFMSILMPSLM